MKNNELFVRKAREQTEKYAIKKSTKRQKEEEEKEEKEKEKEAKLETPKQEKRVEVSDKNNSSSSNNNNKEEERKDTNDIHDTNFKENEEIDSSESSEASWSDCQFLFYESFILLLLWEQERTSRSREENTRFGGHCQFLTLLPFLGVTGDS